MTKESNDWKKRLGVVFSTDPDFNYNANENESVSSLDPSKQNLYVSLDKKQRKGKVVTLISGFVGTEEDLQELGKSIKKQCGTGGSVKEGLIIIQGDFKTRIGEILTKTGYRYKFK